MNDRNIKCAICEGEHFTPDNYCELDVNGQPRVMHLSCYSGAISIVQVIPDAVTDELEMTRQENANLKKQLEQLPPLYTRCADAKPTEQREYLVHCSNGQYNIAAYLPWCNQWLDQYQEQLPVVAWREVPR